MNIIHPDGSTPINNMTIFPRHESLCSQASALNCHWAICIHQTMGRQSSFTVRGARFYATGVTVRDAQNGVTRSRSGDWLNPDGDGEQGQTERSVRRRPRHQYRGGRRARRRTMEKELFERRRVAALCAELPTVETRQAMYSVTALWWKRKKILHALRICLYSYLSNMQCACAILSACPAVKYFSTLSHEWGDFRIYIYILNTKCVFWFSVQFCLKHL